MSFHQTISCISGSPSHTGSSLFAIEAEPIFTSNLKESLIKDHYDTDYIVHNEPKKKNEYLAASVDKPVIYGGLFEDDKSSSDASFVRNWKKSKLERAADPSSESPPEDSCMIPKVQSQAQEDEMRGTISSLSSMTRNSVDLHKMKLGGATE